MKIHILDEQYPQLYNYYKNHVQISKTKTVKHFKV